MRSRSSRGYPRYQSTTKIHVPAGSDATRSGQDMRTSSCKRHNLAHPYGLQLERLRREYLGPSAMAFLYIPAKEWKDKQAIALKQANNCASYGQDIFMLIRVYCFSQEYRAFAFVLIPCPGHDAAKPSALTPPQLRTCIHSPRQQH
jgi:hypothetical protein